MARPDRRPPSRSRISAPPRQPPGAPRLGSGREHRHPGAPRSARRRAGRDRGHRGRRGARPPERTAPGRPRARAAGLHRPAAGDRAAQPAHRLDRRHDHRRLERAVPLPAGQLPADGGAHPASAAHADRAVRRRRPGRRRGGDAGGDPQPARRTVHPGGQQRGGVRHRHRRLLRQADRPFAVRLVRLRRGDRGLRPRLRRRLARRRRRLPGQTGPRRGRRLRPARRLDDGPAALQPADPGRGAVLARRLARRAQPDRARGGAALHRRRPARLPALRPPAQRAQPRRRHGAGPGHAHRAGARGLRRAGGAAHRGGGGRRRTDRFRRPGRAASGTRGGRAGLPLGAALRGRPRPRPAAGRGHPGPRPGPAGRPPRPAGPSFARSGSAGSACGWTPACSASA